MVIYIEKEECHDEAEKHTLVMTDEKCSPCEFYGTCRYVRQELADVMYGD